MIKVTYEETVYECTRAVKGVNYIRLYDSSNSLVAAFEGVSDFSMFTIEDGEWETGRSNRRVGAIATIDDGSVYLTLNENVIVEDGLSIYFNAPANSQDISTIVVDGKDYMFVNAAGTMVNEILNCFCSGSKIEIILDYNDAYLQGGTSNLNVVVSETEPVDVPEGTIWLRPLITL